MTFSLDEYVRAGLIFPTVLVLGSAFGTIWGLIGQLIHISKKTTKSARGFLLMAIFVFVAMLIVNVPHLKHTIYLVTEKETDVLISEGVVEEIRDIRNSPRYDYNKTVARASIVTVGGTAYYFMTKGNLEVGDTVILSYLPKSKIVLQCELKEE